MPGLREREFDILIRGNVAAASLKPSSKRGRTPCGCRLIRGNVAAASLKHVRTERRRLVLGPLIRGNVAAASLKLRSGA